jgi:hypothetical protein
MQASDRPLTSNKANITISPMNTKRPVKSFAKACMAFQNGIGKLSDIRIGKLRSRFSWHRTRRNNNTQVKVSLLYFRFPQEIISGLYVNFSHLASLAYRTHTRGRRTRMTSLVRRPLAPCPLPNKEGSGFVLSLINSRPGSTVTFQKEIDSRWISISRLDSLG